MKLDMNSYLDDPIPGQVYFLYAVIVHRGSAGSGHYIAYINHDSIWFEMNDRKATYVSAQHVLDQNAYMLFYQCAQILDPGFKNPKKRKGSHD
jgi:ubiquitin carboxyl-terminal hydrolase 20/33